MTAPAPHPHAAELEVLIRARYPLLYVVSWEEQRVVEVLDQLSHKLGKKLFCWSVTQGVCDAKGGVVDGSARDPQAVLDYAARVNEGALIVLKDFHPYMQDAGVIRRLRDLVTGFKSTYKTLLILSPTLTIPCELEKDTTVMDFDLPGPPELKALFEQIAAASDGGKKFAVDLKPGEKEKLIQAVQGLTLSEAESTFARAIVQNGKLDIRAVDVILTEIKQIVRKSRQIEYFEAKDEFGQIGGMENLKDWLNKRGKAFTEEARKYGLPQPKGLLLLGVQGCGKSLTCKAISGLWKLPLLRLDMGSIFGGLVGQSEENMRRAIKTAEAVAPCILWLDEIEKGLSGTQSSGTSDAGTTARVFSTFLTWLQEKTKPVFVAATANNISMLPPELLRKGRLDEIFFVDLPSAAERKEIFSIHLKRRQRDPAKFAVDALAQQSAGYSGAEIEQAVIEGLSEAFTQGREVTDADFATAIKHLVPLSKTMREEIEHLRQWAATRARPASRAAEGAPAPAPSAGGFGRAMELPR
jgi:ATP-dependent 26S proteasome regulatory subunit